MSVRQRRRKRALRTLAAPFTVAAPSGARIRDRLRLTAAEHDVLRRVGQHLGRQRGPVPALPARVA